MSSDTDKCPKCGSDITYHGTARPTGGGQVARCYNCGFAAEKTLIEEQIVVAAKHRIRELEMTEQILRGGAEHLKRRVQELEAEVARLRDRDGGAAISVLEPTQENPFARAKLKIADFGVSDNIYVVEQSDRYRELEARIETLELTVKVLESDKQTRNDALDHERKRIAAKDAALRVLESLGERLTDFDPPGPVTDEQRREDQYGRKIQNVAREALEK